MALNLSTLTSPATSGDVLAEALTTADFLEPVPVLRNLARGSQKGGDAKQSVSLNQPKALPLIKNPQGNLGGYLYIPDVSGNYATGPSVTIGANETWEGELDMVITEFGNNLTPFGGGDWSAGFGILFYQDGSVRLFSKGTGGAPVASGVTLGTAFSAKYGYDGTNIFVDIDGSRKYTGTAGQSGSITHNLELNQQAGITNVGNYAIQKAKLTVNNAVVFDCDFNGSKSIRHGDQKWKAAVGGVVSIAKPELITNGNFDTDTAWTKGAGWTIADGVATIDNTSGTGSSSLASTIFSVTSGTNYKIVVDVISTSSGFRLYDVDGVLSYTLNVGRNVFYKEVTSSTYQITPLGLAGSSGSIDNISVTEVLSDSGRDPITIIKKSVLRFDGANSGLNGLFANNIDGGYMFAAFSVLGDGGADWGRVFTTNLVGSGTDYSGAGAGFSLRSADTTNLLTITQGLSQSMGGMFDAANGDILHEVKLEGSDFSSKVNNAGFLSATHSNTIDSDRFNIGQDFTQFVTQNGAIDLEFLALFSADSVPDEATASKIRNYINNRNNVFDLKDGFGYYFYDAQKANEGKVASWNGRIVGSDFGDTDRYLTQGTSDDQPVGDGYVVTFADNTDHLEIPQVTLASGDSYAWMVCGTSLGTFAYKVTVSGQTELTLLGHLGNATYRQAGDLYGIILLPESATGADIEAARKLLIDRGAADGATLTSYFAAWVARSDIVEFKNINFGSATNFGSAWENTGLTSFDTPLPSATDVRFAWYGCTSLSDFRTTDIKNCTNFTGAFQGCSALTSFPAGAKLGTAASSGVNFTSAWQSSGLTSFPALDLSNGNIFTSAWKSCTSLTSFPAGAKLGTAASNVNMANAWQDASLTSFPLLDLSSATNFAYTWRGNDLTSFPKIDVSNGSVFINTWRFNQSLTDFPAGLFDTWNPSSINNTVFTDAWDGCTSLTAQSVENILVSIDASGQYATRDGNSGSIAITDAGIDIDYDGTTLSAATNSAVTSLKSKGWSIIVNNVTL